MTDGELSARALNERDRLVLRALTLVREDARRRRDDAGWDDGDGERLEEQLRFFQYGRVGAFPPEWSAYMEQATRESDPDYARYLELRRKFEGGDT